MKVLILFPSLRYPNIEDMGGFKIKSTALAVFKVEDQEIKKELYKLQHFFSQKGARPIDSFSYIDFSCEEKELEQIFEKIKKDLEIYRFLALGPESNNSLYYEHTIPYICFPRESNPYHYKDGDDIYSYHIQVNFNSDRKYLSYSTKRKTNQSFNLIVNSDSPPPIKEKEYTILRERSSDKDIVSLYWYHKTYSNHLEDSLENLLRTSTAFETLIDIDRKKGKKIRLEELNKTIEKKEGVGSLSDDQKIVVKGFLQEKLTGQYADKIFEITGSESIKNWFKDHFYPTGSSIRHGSSVEIIPTKRDPDKRQKNEKKRSLFYGENASHHFLNNAYFAKKLFKFIYFELHYPSEPFSKSLNISHLESLLISDEERLKKLESYVLGAKAGKLELKPLEMNLPSGGSYSGDKGRVYLLLQKLLGEISICYKDSWKEIKDEAKIIIETNAEDVPFDDYEGFKPFFSAIIEIDSKLDSLDKEYLDEDDFKFFSIKEFVSYSLHRLL